MVVNYLSHHFQIEWKSFFIATCLHQALLFRWTSYSDYLWNKLLHVNAAVDYMQMHSTK